MPDYISHQGQDKFRKFDCYFTKHSMVIHCHGFNQIELITHKNMFVDKVLNYLDGISSGCMTGL